MAEVGFRTVPLKVGVVPGASRSLPTISATGASERPWRFVLFWALGWAGVGLGVGLVILLTKGSFSGSVGPLKLLLDPISRLSVLFAEVVGLTALFSSRLIFPYYAALPYVPRLLLQVATSGGGAIFGTIVAVAMVPLVYALHNYQLIIVMAVVNGTLALMVGIAVNTYESMKRQIELSYADLHKKEAFEREMEIAREVQEQLFPKTVPCVRGLELAGACVPAAGVGGDYYDYLPFSEDRVGLVVADVSGKGISAALLMASLQASVRNVTNSGVSPCEVNRQINQILYRSTTASRYATLFLGLFDSADRTLRYSNAGHNPAMVINGSGAFKLTEGGLPLGVLDGSRYREGSRELQSGDLLVLYTDGAVEASDPSGQEFGLDRLVGFLQPRSKTRDLPGLIEDTLAEVRSWTAGAPQQDDITLVIARAVDAH